MDGESQNVRDARVEDLWRKLDPEKQGSLDLAGLKRGLERIDHPLKDAEGLIKDVLKALDADGDGRIQYSEFRTFVEHTERELWKMFQSIDRDRNGRLDQRELRLAFKTAGMAISKPKLDQFFSEVDSNHDGVITFDEWRNFLLFLPAQQPGLRAVFSYYSSTVTVNPEGDVHVSNEKGQGLGIGIKFLTSFLGTFIAALQPPRHSQPPIDSSPPQPLVGGPSSSIPSRDQSDEVISNTFPWDPGENKLVEMQSSTSPNGSPALSQPLPQAASQPQNVIDARSKSLTSLAPHPGYFLAGGIAGVASRTLTAPLDRLKVYLIAQTGVRDETVHAVKQGAPVQAAKVAARPLRDALAALWQMGGVRSFFAGNGLNVVKVMPESAVKFGSYEASKRLMARLEGHDDTKHLKYSSEFLAAGMAGVVSQFSIYPLDTLKFRMQNETTAGGPHGNALIRRTFQKLYHSPTGMRSFYRGLPMGLIGIFPYSAIDMSTFHYVKRRLAARSARRLGVAADAPAAAPGNVATAAMGAFSGAFGSTAVYPLNLLRTRLQSQGTAIHPATYTGIADVAVQTVGREGWRGLYRGLTPNLLKVMPAVSITWVVYENMKKVLGLP